MQKDGVEEETVVSGLVTFPARRTCDAEPGHWRQTADTQGHRPDCRSLRAAAEEDGRPAKHVQDIAANDNLSRPALRFGEKFLASVIHDAVVVVTPEKFVVSVLMPAKIDPFRIEDIQ